MFRQSVTGPDLQQDIKTLLVSIDGLVDQISDSELQPKMMADGGITQGVSIAGEAGPEAVVPLPDGKSIPVDVDLGGVYQQLAKISGGRLPLDIEDRDALVKFTAEKILKSVVPELRQLETVQSQLSDVRAAVTEPNQASAIKVLGILNPGASKTLSQVIQMSDVIRNESDAFDKILDVISIFVPKLCLVRSGLQTLKTFVPEQGSSGPSLTQPPTFAQGGITSGVSIAGESGPEAVVPLPDGKTIPVTINLRDPEQTGPTAMGFNEYRGYNAGPISTDINALKDIAGQLGAFDRATQTITDPETWKKILNSGMLLNYNTGFLEIGTRLAPGIGVEIGERVKEIMATDNTGVTEALGKVKDEFSTAMSQVVEQLIAAQRDSYPQEVIDILERIDRNQSRVADSSQRMAEAAAN
jgi:hypothetical protein